MSAQPPFMPISKVSFGSRLFVMATMPVGPFSRKLAFALRKRGGRVQRILNNGGDLVDWGTADSLRPPNGIKWETWLAETLKTSGATDIVTLGDANRYSAGAVLAARSEGLRTHILEQGYLRPNWVTYEHLGVNARSHLPRSPEFYRALPPPPPFLPLTNIAPIAFPEALHSVRYQVNAFAMGVLFPNYVYPHRFGAMHQLVGHSARALGARFQKKRDYMRAQDALLGEDGPLFIVLLQREGDNQFLVHSDIADNPTLIRAVTASFSARAPRNARLVVRNHPLDPAIYNLAETTRQSAAAYGAEGRVTFLDHTPLAPVLRRCVGAVTVNSTAAITAIEFGVPTKLLGRAFFDIEGLVDKQPLETFWEAPSPPDHALFERFRAHVLAETQIFGNFFNRKHISATVEALADRFWA